MKAMNQESLTLNLERHSVGHKNTLEDKNSDIPIKFDSVKEPTTNTKSGCQSKGDHRVWSILSVWNKLQKSLRGVPQSTLVSPSFPHAFSQPRTQCNTSDVYQHLTLQNFSAVVKESGGLPCLACCDTGIEEEDGPSGNSDVLKADKTVARLCLLSETSATSAPTCCTDNEVMRVSYHVYDGGGTRGSDDSFRNARRDEAAHQQTSDSNLVLSSRVNSINISSCPSEANLLPEPEEQIGSPVSEEFSKVTQVTFPPQAANSSSRPMPGTRSEVKQGIWSAIARLDSQTPKPIVFVPEKPACIPAPPMTDHIAGTTQKPSCSKRFVNSTLRYKSKCRSYKLLILAVCYLSAVLIILALRQLDQVEDPEDTHAQKNEAIVRSKRFAVLTSLMKNDSKCQAADDRNNNEIFIMSYDAFVSGGWIVHVIIGMYTFAAIAAICDIYFVPALEHICEDLKLEADVAGATFMAAASSAPEFCTSVIGIFVQESDVGLGAIVGSSIFNLLAIVGLCAIFAGMPVDLSWYPLTRDSIFYTVAVFEMLAFMFDSIVQWYEALVMIMTYALYILVMVYNKKIEQLAVATETKPVTRHSSFMSEAHRTHSARLEIIRARSHSRSSSHNLRLSVARLRTLRGSSSDQIPRGSAVVSLEKSSVVSQSHAVTSNHEEPPSSPPPAEQDLDTAADGTSADPRKAAQVVSAMVEAPPIIEVVEEVDEEHAVAEYENPLHFPEGCASRAYWIVVLPVTVLHAYTIPDSRIQDSWQSRFYMIPFTLSVLYLAIYSYIMVWAMSVAAWGLKIPQTVAGLTILAAGTSVPDCLSSIFVARDGYGDMAVSNAIGSNVFDILLCLGVPWLVTGFMEDGHLINSNGMWVAGSTLVVTILYLIISLKLSNWTLTPVYGLCTLAIYILIISFCIVVELGLIFNLKKSKCPYGVIH